ncbi:hypothetical protein NE237_002133 [Protea cynaroides]|uniref:Reverse transcriptase domain-containing protein n=1 Tax=Protea cynaroides TaxID=273540 RepID=A0A9Q0KUN9_9MAGN|nr:hypothetical protein NE237_002133 [Protea cynaroides]
MDILPTIDDRAIQNSFETIGGESGPSIGDSENTRPRVDEGPRPSIADSEDTRPSIDEGPRLSIGDSSGSILKEAIGKTVQYILITITSDSVQPILTDIIGNNMHNNESTSTEAILNSFKIIGSEFGPSIGDSENTKPSIDEGLRPSIGDSEDTGPSIDEGLRPSIGGSSGSILKEAIGETVEPTLIKITSDSVQQPTLIDIIGNSMHNNELTSTECVTHFMVTRSKLGVRKPNPKYALTTITIPTESTIIKEALAHDGSKAAMDLEMAALKTNNTWILVPKDPHMNLVGCK